jgi:hypothetical protein
MRKIISISLLLITLSANATILGKNNWGGESGFTVFIGDTTPDLEDFTGHTLRNLDEYRSTLNGNTYVYRSGAWYVINYTAI